MKMISSAKLHKAQNMVENFLPYERQLTRILGNYLAAEETYTTPLAERREEIRRVTLVAVTSNSSLCGAFNSNIIGMFAKTYKEYLSQNVEVEIYAIGKKIDDNIRKHFLCSFFTLYFFYIYLSRCCQKARQLNRLLRPLRQIGRAHV